MGAVLVLAGALSAGLLGPPARSAAAPGAVSWAAPPAHAETADAELMKVVNQLLADPIGEAGIRAHMRLKLTDGNRNLAIVWFDVTEYPPPIRAKLARAFGDVNVLDIGPYRGYGTMLNHAGNERLFDRMGVLPGRTLLQLGAVNVPRADHSELVIYDKFLRAMLQRLGLGTADVEKLMSTEVGGYSDRGRCQSCLALTKNIPAKNFVSAVPYVTSQDRKASANQVNAVTSKAIGIVQHADLLEEIKAAEAMAAAGNPKPLARLQRDWPQLFPKGCTSMPGDPVGGGGRGPALAMVASAAGDCGDEEIGGLARALTAPVDPGSYGGVDFSTLEMRYISDRPGSDGVRYAYSSRPLAPGYLQNKALGMRVVQTLGADLRTWLVLDPRKFWVNLNPTEPDRIIDPALGQTNAGRAMLEADLQMKRTEGKILHPDTPTGARFWRELRFDPSGRSCFSSRTWIVPGRVEVREEDGALYILRALLDVKTQSEHIDDPYAESCPRSDPATDAHNERLVRSLVLPEIVKAVNNAPEYAPLRRAFMARIIAQWVRERHQRGRRTSFDEVIDSGDLGRSKMQDSWRPKQVFDAYVHSYRHKEFDITRRTRDGNTIRISRYAHGGADLTRVQLTAVSAADMRRRYPHLPQTVRTSAGRPVTAADGSIWLGGTTRPPDRGFWAGIGDKASRLTEGRGITLLVILLGLAAVAFGFRGSRRRQRPAS